MKVEKGMHYAVKCVKTNKDLRDAQAGTKFERPRTRTISCFRERDLISMHAIDTRSVMLEETCNATAALLILHAALRDAFNVDTSSQNATKCYQKEGHSPVFQNAFRKNFSCFSRQNHCLPLS